MQLQGFSACSEAAVQGRKGKEAPGKLHKLSRLTAMPCFATSLSGEAVEKIHTGLQQHGSEIKGTLTRPTWIKLS